jgi:L-serine dehydratase
MPSLRALLPSAGALVVFEAAARHGSFTRAAGELSMSQAAVSHAVRQLEDVLGRRLFNRLHRGVELTGAGERFFQDVSIGLAHIRRSAEVRQRETLTRHPNGIRFRALDAGGGEVLLDYYYSVGGGFVMNEREAEAGPAAAAASNVAVPFPFRSAAELLELCRAEGLTIAELVLRNEQAWRDEAEIRAGLLRIWEAMEGSIERGCRTPGTLPGALHVRRRAAAMHAELTRRPEASLPDHLAVLDWVNLYALAVNEENAAGGRVVTAPTNGAAGVIPAVLAYYTRFVPGADADGVVRFLLTAGAVGMLYKENASISAAEVGCQGEVGVACSMAAGGLCAVLGGSNEQVENAAEIGMEHNLGLTCDPIGGLVQIPCIERNTMGAVKAINAARLALRGDGTHHVPLDRVIATMRETGRDMSAKYKETSQGGLAVNVVEC